ncbi:NAD(P)-binding protein [Apiospora kogelbergensis]|uniref:NAD(P)-binding protein n=1 Tax=Apiospora kogelbergensis TaxID=1337665 RepID=A0AAW0RBS0_9PEZI
MLEIFSVKGKRVVISGGARGLGSAIARVLVAEGAHVAIIDIQDEAGEKHAASLTAAGPGMAYYFHADVAKRDEAFAAMAGAVDVLGGLDALHNNAGVERAAPIEDIAEADVDLVFGVNVKGGGAAPAGRGGGAIVNFGSDTALMPFPASAVYSASKGALHSLTRSMAAAWAPHGIRVNTALPAAKTDMYYDTLAKMTDEERSLTTDELKRIILLGGEMGNVDDFTPMMVYLTSDASRFVTGQIMAVNGGMNFVR